jgi:hypothetical protein
MWNAATAKGLRRVAEFCLDRPLRRGRLGHHVQLVGAFRGDAGGRGADRLGPAVRDALEAAGVTISAP